VVGGAAGTVDGAFRGPGLGSVKPWTWIDTRVHGRKVHSQPTAQSEAFL
jgi:hypothetical protein